VLGEEFGDDGGDVRWIVDPIDGTTNYVRGTPVWGTLLALEREGRVECALVSAPALGGRRWWATLGGGAFANGALCRVSEIAQVEDATISTTSARRLPAGWTELVRRAWANRGFGDFWQYCLLAEGSLEIATDTVMNVWDYAGVQLLVEEAGGRCTTFAGGEPQPLGSFVATNGLLHDEAVALLRT
jgi:histidinol-phosphatase